MCCPKEVGCPKDWCTLYTNYFRHNEDFLTDDVCLPRRKVGFGIGIRDPCNGVAVAP